jgi:hypothetical protein
MNSRLPFFSFFVIVTVFFMTFMSGCGQTPLLDPSFNFDPGAQYTQWYVSAAGKDSNMGNDPAMPLASVRAALARIKSLYRGKKWKAGESAVIIISGTIRGSGPFGDNGSMVDISGAGNYPAIVLKGDPVKGGVLDAGRPGGNGGRVLYIANNKVTLDSNLTLTGGSRLWGGAVCIGTPGVVSSGEFVMAGGEISGNVAGSGGGVFVYTGAMTMTGGVIKNNITTFNKYGGSGGGVFVYEFSTFTMTGGTIENNGGAATENGGGVAADGKARFIMTGGTIRANTSSIKGGGVHVSPDGSFSMSGGTISGNNSKGSGGGVFVSLQYGGVFTQSGGTVSGNTPDEIKQQ